MSSKNRLTFQRNHLAFHFLFLINESSSTFLFYYSSNALQKKINRLKSMILLSVFMTFLREWVSKLKESLILQMRWPRNSWFEEIWSHLKSYKLVFSICLYLFRAQAARPSQTSFKFFSPNLCDQFKINSLSLNDSQCQDHRTEANSFGLSYLSKLCSSIN